jgi:PAS domain S-box-containing protein
MNYGTNSARGPLRLLTIAPLIVSAIVLLSPLMARARQSPRPSRVLVLHWYDKDYSWNVNFERTFRAGLQSNQGKPVEYYPEYLESNRFPGENQASFLHDYLRQKYADRAIDVFVANSDASLDFIMKYRDDLFPDTPIVFLAAKNPTKDAASIGRSLTGVINLSAHKKTVDLALRLHPETKEVFVVSGTLEHDKKFETLAREQLQGYERRVRISYLTDNSPDELIAKVKTLPERSILLYVWQQAETDQGKVLESFEILSLIAGVAKVPIYGMSTPYIGSGAIGGYVNTAATSGTRLAEIVLQIVNGTPARDVPVEIAPTEAMFDSRQLARWKINEDDLPAGSVIRFKDSSLWNEHKRLVVGVVALLALQTGLISWLLVEHRRRRLAEEARRHLAAIVESSNDAIIGSSIDGEILSWNPGAEAMYGYSADEMLGRHISVIVPPEQMEEFSARLKRRKDGERINDFETVRLKKDGTLLNVSVSVSVIRDHKGRMIAAASITRDVSERKRSESELQRLSSHLLNLQDIERRRLARELHDVTAQNMFVVNMNLSRLQRTSVDGSESQAILAESKELCDQALQEIRTLSYVLHPPMLDEAGLVRALRWYLDGFIKRSGIQIDMNAISEIGRLPTDVEMALFRIVQEGLTNIRRHSGSNSAGITLEKEDNQVVLRISDQGRGMQKTTLAETDGGTLGVGIAGMRQRLRHLGGILEIDSSECGVMVTAKVPISTGVNDASDLVSRRSQNSA